jgi:syntaxin of plants SYP7
MSDPIDTELTELIGRLTKIQNQLGGPKSSKAKSGGYNKYDRFMELKDQMIDQLSIIKETFEDIQLMEKTPGSNPRELITAQSKVRTGLATLADEYRELDQEFKKEAKKRRSKLSPEELAQREQILTSIQTEIQRVKEIQRAGFVQEYKGVQLKRFEDSELFNSKNHENGDEKGAEDGDLPRPRGVVTGSRNNNMTDQQRVQLQMVKERDAQIDAEIELIGEGVDFLHDLARTMNEEIKLQGKMLESLETKIDDVHEHVTTVNEKLKSTLEDARKSDKICVVGSDTLCF